jgi:hypothetical protein
MGDREKDRHAALRIAVAAEIARLLGAIGSRRSARGHLHRDAASANDMAINLQKGEGTNELD